MMDLGCPSQTIRRSWTATPNQSIAIIDVRAFTTVFQFLADPAHTSTGCFQQIAFVAKSIPETSQHLPKDNADLSGDTAGDLVAVILSMCRHSHGGQQCSPGQGKSQTCCRDTSSWFVFSLLDKKAKAFVHSGVTRVSGHLETGGIRGTKVQGFVPMG